MNINVEANCSVTIVEEKCKEIVMNYNFISAAVSSTSVMEFMNFIRTLNKCVTY